MFSGVETNSTDVSLAAFLDVAIKIMNLIKLLCEVKKMIGKNVVVVVGGGCRCYLGVTCRQGVRRQRINNREKFEESPNGGSNPLTSTKCER